MIMGSPRPVASRTTVIAILMTALGTSVDAQPCNPVIDGTYCASLPTKAPNRATGAPQAGSLGAILSSPPGVGEPGMLGAITFNSEGTRCLGGLLRGVRCN
jgi:hypothetical protein